MKKLNCLLRVITFPTHILILLCPKHYSFVTEDMIKLLKKKSPQLRIILPTVRPVENNMSCPLTTGQGSYPKNKCTKNDQGEEHFSSSKKSAEADLAVKYSKLETAYFSVPFCYCAN